MADVKQIQQMIPLITCEIPFGENVCELVFGVDAPDLDFGVQIDSIKQPIKSNSVSSGDVSHCRTSAFHIHFIYSFIVLKTHTIKLLDSRIGHLRERNQCFPLHRFAFEIYDVS